MSPNPAWNIFFSFISFFGAFYLLIFTPLSYFLLGRPFDKKFPLKFYTIEKGIWFISTGARLTGYTIGILLQPFREKKINNKFFSEVIRKVFNYQDKIYGQAINFREYATAVQKTISVFFWFGLTILLISAFLLIIHDFVIYPEVGKVRLKENY